MLNKTGTDPRDVATRPSRVARRALALDVEDHLPPSTMRGRTAALRVGLALLVSIAVFALGFGQFGSRMIDLEWGRRSTRAERVVSETLNLLAACPLDEVEALHGTSIPASGAGGAADWRIDFAVTPSPSGFRIRATLVDEKTVTAVRDFVAWRGRT